MAIWQYQIFIVPEEEINSYFEKDGIISSDALNEINWWKYRQLDITSFDVFKVLFSIRESWTKDIILFGDEGSSCIEILMEEGRIIEISARIDLRYNYKQFVTILCEFAQKNNCTFLNNDLKIISTNTQLIEQDIENYTVYKSFFDKLL